MATFSLSRSSLNLTPPSITGGPPSKYSLAGQAVNAANIWKANRAGAQTSPLWLLRKPVAEANIFNALKDAEASIMKGGLQGYTTITAKKTADQMKKDARRGAQQQMASSALGAVGTIGGSIIGGLLAE